MDCGTPLLLMGLLAPQDRGPSVQPGPPDAKGLLGEPWPYELRTENFAVLYGEGVDEGVVETTARHLEDAWAALIEEQGWPGPQQSEDFLVRVELDPALAWTGYTVTAESQVGTYPIVQLNPRYASTPAFYASLVAHEFAHTLHFALRHDYAGGPEEPWYWEASAEWAAERALPDVDAYAMQVVYYADQPQLRYSSMEGFHAYGMSVLNATLEERLGVEMLEVWLEAELRPGESWDGIISDVSGLPAPAVWAELGAAYGNEGLAESHLYPEPLQAALELGVERELAWLGTHYLRAETALRVRAEGPVLLSGPEGVAEEVELEPGDMLAVTGAAEGAVYSLERVVAREPKGECSGCGGGLGGGWLWLLSPALIRWRRASRRGRSGCGRRPGSRPFPPRSREGRRP